eukprot:COSAG02_NODE_6020_length_3870_cov_25.718377_3_plen_235_part_00
MYSTRPGAVPVASTGRDFSGSTTYYNLIVYSTSRVALERKPTCFGLSLISYLPPNLSRANCSRQIGGQFSSGKSVPETCALVDSWIGFRCESVFRTLPCNATLWSGLEWDVHEFVLTNTRTTGGPEIYAVECKICCRLRELLHGVPRDSLLTQREEGFRYGSTISTLVTELCVLRTFGGVDFSLIFICAQSVPEFLWDRLRASIQFQLVPKRAQYARFSGELMLSSAYPKCPIG